MIDQTGNSVPYFAKSPPIGPVFKNLYFPLRIVSIKPIYLSSVVIFCLIDCTFNISDLSYVSLGGGGGGGGKRTFFFFFFLDPKISQRLSQPLNKRGGVRGHFFFFSQNISII